MQKMLKIEPIIEKFNMLFRGNTITMLAINSEFTKRKPRKIEPCAFLITFFITVIQGAKSLTALATTLGLLKGTQISKQAIDKRIKEPFVIFLQSTLAFTIARKITDRTYHFSSQFKRILINDSTTIRLPPHLACQFPGSKNARKKDIAIMKVQVLYDLLKEQFSSLTITPFTINDQEASTTTLDYLKEGDLLIRDLGYFVLSVFNTITTMGAYFISRLRYGVVISDPETGTRLNLLKLLKKHQKLDMTAVLGTEEKVTVRLIALPVDPAIANQRRRKLKVNRDRRLNPGMEHLALLGWNIFILNVDAHVLTPEQVVQLYRLRWRIETIFKAWKSNFAFAEVPRASTLRLKAYIYAFFIFITLFQTLIFIRSSKKINQSNVNHLSLLKFSRFFKEQFWAIVLFWTHKNLLLEQIYYHCTYEERMDRLNYPQKLALLS